MLHQCCVRLHTLLHVVVKFETGQTFSYVQTDATTPNIVGQKCLQWLRLFTRTLIPALYLRNVTMTVFQRVLIERTMVAQMRYSGIVALLNILVTPGELLVYSYLLYNRDGKYRGEERKITEYAKTVTLSLMPRQFRRISSVLSTQLTVGKLF